MGPTLENIADALASGSTTSVKLVEDCLTRIDDATGEGATTFLVVARESALEAARGIDALRKAGAAPSRFAGIPVSIKDLFDIEGDVTRAGSRVLDEVAPALHDAIAVTRLKHAGFVVMGRTNMTEFAFSGVGINPHYGTPRNIWQRERGRVPGGSSSGAAIALTDGMAHVSLGTDTGGSCRIPAAFNGLVGYKPTARRVPLAGAFSLSTTLDSIGPIGRTVACCAAVDAVLAGLEPATLVPRSPRGLRIAVPLAYVLEDLDIDVARNFKAALARLSEAGAIVEEVPFPEIEAIPKANARGGFAAPESLSTHRKLIAAHADLYDSRVLARIERGHEQSAADYVDLIRTRAAIIAEFEAHMGAYDVLAYPTVPIVPPLISAFESDADFSRLNMLILRNPAVINMLDGCSISMPMSRVPDAPTGLMLSAPSGHDRDLLAIAAGVEMCLV
ncbi:MAG: Amidase [Hyphomicrobiales bacterium]|nr:Amidase [Hyphomicrobiales bacterium]